MKAINLRIYPSLCLCIKCQSFLLIARVNDWYVPILLFKGQSAFGESYAESPAANLQLQACTKDC